MPGPLFLHRSVPFASDLKVTKHLSSFNGGSGVGLFDAVSNELAPWEKMKTSEAGNHRSTSSTSFAAIYATFVPTFITASIFIIIFSLIRNSYRIIYLPRTFLTVVPERDQTPVSSRKSIGWVRELWKFDDKFVLQHQSLDGYLFLRFFKIICLICGVGCCITFPILIPVNYTGGGKATQLDRISFSNISGSDRLWAHTVVAWLFLGITMAIIARERLFVIHLRQAFLLSKENSARLSSKVVLFLSVPHEALHEDHMHHIFGKDAVRIWPVSKLSELEKAVQDRNDKATALENAEVDFSVNATKRHHQRHKKNSNGDPNGADETSQGEQLEESSRPRHKSKIVVGQEVDTILELREEIQKMTEKVEKLRQPRKHKDSDHTSAVFVEFRSQGAAHQAYQHVHYHNPLRMQPRYIGVTPKEAIWDNLTLHPTDRIVRGYLAIAFITATIILWSIPIGFVAAISNINYLTDKVPFLRFINGLPKPILGFIQGFVPPYVMSTFVSYVPNFFRYVAKTAGDPTVPEAELRTQLWYFAFQVIQVFLVTTFSSGAAAVATKIINQPNTVPELLANNLPKASNFYLTYFILQGTATSAKNLLNYSDLLTYLGYTKFLDKTPRQQYTRFSTMKGIGWGSVYPKFTNMAIIAIAYSCIAPLVLGFATIGLMLFYVCYRYNLIYALQTKVDTKGEAYARALQHLLTGVYLSELCLIGLFSAREAPGPSALMIVLFISSILLHFTFNRLIDPLEKCIPSDLLSEDEDETTPLRVVEEGFTEEGSDVEDADNEDSTTHRIRRFARSKLSHQFLDPLARAIEPHVFFSAHSLSTWFHDPKQNTAEDDPALLPQYTDEDLKNAYLNPALTSKIPKLWLARDELGISKKEIEENKKVGITATDEGATLDEKGKVHWNHSNLEEVPIFKRPVKF